MGEKKYILVGIALIVISLIAIPVTGDGTLAVIFIPAGIYMVIKYKEVAELEYMYEEEEKTIIKKPPFDQKKFKSHNKIA